VFRDVIELLDDDASVLAEEDDGVGCPLPSTPEDEHLLDCEVRMRYGHRRSCNSVTISLAMPKCGLNK
jgi:hypothetical protein